MLLLTVEVGEAPQSLEVGAANTRGHKMIRRARPTGRPVHTDVLLAKDRRNWTCPQGPGAQGCAWRLPHGAASALLGRVSQRVQTPRRASLQTQHV